MKKSLDGKKGVTLASIIMISAIVIIIVYITIFVLKGGLKVLSKASTAKKETENSRIYEGIDLIISNFGAHNANIQQVDSFENYLKTEKNIGDINNYWCTNEFAIVNYNNYYVMITYTNDDFKRKGIIKVEDDTYAEKMIQNYKKSIDQNCKDKIKFEDKNTYIISNLVRTDCYDYTVGDNQDVTLAIYGNIEINNKKRKGSAIDIGVGGNLNLYVLDDTTISSLYNGEDTIEYNRITSNSGYAGIHVPLNSKLCLFGDARLKVYGGPAGKGRNL